MPSPAVLSRCCSLADLVRLSPTPLTQFWFVSPSRSCKIPIGAEAPDTPEHKSGKGMAMFSSSTLQVVKAAARSQFGDLEGVVGFGIGDQVLRIYVRNAEVGKRLPVEFQGVPVEVVVTGEVSAQ